MRWRLIALTWAFVSLGVGCGDNGITEIPEDATIAEVVAAAGKVEILAAEQNLVTEDSTVVEGD
jgi:hypothetical protein